ncbi:hypothetical protein N752_02210 [Desulforamulus aquiferis]|nr:copper amine oxidase N-terminal domain-containing protein [Desulforamulus aquiferis]RYD06837.1 hypothetical protein N752_02210 [Desulforamulus aquiferis]
MAGISALLLLPSQAVANNIGIVVNDQAVVIPPEDQQAMLLNGRTYVPLRVISENLGASIEWNNDTKRVLIQTLHGNITDIPERVGSSFKEVEIVVDGQVLNVHPDYGVPFVSSMGRTMVPLRAVGEALAVRLIGIRILKWWILKNKDG